ncbi:unnamed protein product [Prunus armeniaca]
MIVSSAMLELHGFGDGEFLLGLACYKEFFLAWPGYLLSLQFACELEHQHLRNPLAMAKLSIGIYAPLVW